MASITLQGASEALAHVQNLVDRLSDLQPVLETIGSDLALLSDEAFEGSRGPNGEGWETLKESTENIHPRRAGSAQILVDSGRLRASLRPVFGERSVHIATDVVYAATHQFGRRGNRVFGQHPGPIPARPFFPLNAQGETVLPDSTKEEITRTIVDYLKNG